jgi:hypothetical protein
LIFQSIGAVAQSVEQRTENPCVGGSIPPHTTKQDPAILPGSCFIKFKTLLSLPVNPASKSKERRKGIIHDRLKI